MLLNILSIIVNVIYFIVLRTELYTDRAMLPDGNMREWQHSPIDRLYAADKPGLLYLQLLFAVVSVITGVLILFGVRNDIVRMWGSHSSAGAPRQPVAPSVRSPSTFLAHARSTAINAMVYGMPQ